MSVWHNDTFGRNSFLGEVDVDLSGWDFGNTRINEYVLQARVSVADHSGAAGAWALHMSRWNISGFARTVALLALHGRQRTNESRREIPATDVPQ